MRLAALDTPGYDRDALVAASQIVGSGLLVRAGGFEPPTPAV